MSASRSGTRIRWVSMLAVGTIVVAAGFAVGIVAGVTWEEPGLVIGWLTGETDGIEWSADSGNVAELERSPESEAIPDVAAPPPLGMRNGDATPAADRHVAIPEAWPPEDDSHAPAPAAVAASRPTPPAPAAPARPAAAAKTGKFSVQVGAFADRAAADELSASLRKAGYSVYLSDSQRGARWRVRVGPHRTREAAEITAKRLEAKQQLPTWVLSEDS